jgi:hypothetical protein
MGDLSSFINDMMVNNCTNPNFTIYYLILLGIPMLYAQYARKKYVNVTPTNIIKKKC